MNTLESPQTLYSCCKLWKHILDCTSCCPQPIRCSQSIRIWQLTSQLLLLNSCDSLLLERCPWLKIDVIPLFNYSNPIICLRFYRMGSKKLWKDLYTLGEKKIKFHNIDVYAIDIQNNIIWIPLLLKILQRFWNDNFKLILKAFDLIMTLRGSCATNIWYYLVVRMSFYTMSIFKYKYQSYLWLWQQTSKKKK